jgi:WD40 repeat protein
MPDITIPIYSIETDESNIKSIAFHPTLPIFAAASNDRRNHIAKLWRFFNTFFDELITNVPNQRIMINSVAFHPTLPILATGGNLTKLWEFGQGNSLSHFVTLKGHIDVVNSVAFHPSLPFLATGSDDNSAILWHLDIGGNNKTVSFITQLANHSRAVSSVAFHPSLPILATGSLDKTVILWQIDKDETKLKILKILEEHRNEVLSVAFHPSLPVLATGSSDKTAKLWHVKFNDSVLNNKSCICISTTQQEHEREVKSVAFHPTLPILATGSKDQTTKLWMFTNPNGNLINSSLLSSIATLIPWGINNSNPDNYSVNSVSFHPNLPILATGCDHSPINFWKLNHEGIAVDAENTHFSNEEKVINIEENLLNPKNNSKNNSCPNFLPLYNFIMEQDLTGHFIFHYEKQPVVDVGGPKRDVFEKILPIYTNKFFESVESNNNFLILKNMPEPQKEVFKEETDKMISLAKAANTKIFLKIDPRLLYLLKSDNIIEYFNNTKKKNFEKLYKFFEEEIQQLNIRNGINNYFINSPSNHFKNKESINSLINPGEFNKLNNNIKKEIRLRRFAKDCGFITWKQLKNMNEFIKKENLKEIFMNELKFDIESFSKKLKIEKEDSSYNITEIPLDKFGKLSVDKSNFVFNDQYNSNISNFFYDYFYLYPLLQFILGQKSTEENRKIFTTATTGSAYYPGNVTIRLSNSAATGINRPFKPATCLFYLELYKNPSKEHPSKENKRNLDTIMNDIKIQLTHNKDFGRA